jgi:hypothetical protein
MTTKRQRQPQKQIPPLRCGMTNKKAMATATETATATAAATATATATANGDAPEASTAAVSLRGGGF